MIFSSTFREFSLRYRNMFSGFHRHGRRAVLIVLISSFHLVTSAPAQDLGAELIAAARTGKILRLRALLGTGTDPNLTDKDGWTPLMRAAESGRVECVEALLEAKADVNLKNHGGASALLAASYMGHARTISVLLKRGADINIRTIAGITPLMATSYEVIKTRCRCCWTRALT